MSAITALPLHKWKAEKLQCVQARGPGCLGPKPTSAT